MLRKIDNRNMGSSNLGWLKSKFHFSFAEYYNPNNINFGALRVINDDLIQTDTGFDTHPHKDMEIITYVIHGELTHKDSMGNKNTITRGHVQYMSAGTGVYHSEHNLGKDELRLLQIWIFPDEKGYIPNYGDFRFQWNDRKNKWLHMVSNKDGAAQIKINQDVNIYSLELDKGKEINFEINKNRQAYLVQIEGTSIIDEIELNEQDGMEIIEEYILIKAKENTHILILEMKKEN
ncbi:pirin family protein [Clostridium sp. SHJSY1]|uniref:pirin family protein n=1 Tax=Clostridium sp. SHJSY1 TaxID=2942483 RepID=UPI002874272E|nr:pirin family protein [Clostridium sp. SHJSY1]MDS0526975.1 pirin family protein [Clostridium sp. SHJSY1]